MSTSHKVASIRHSPSSPADNRKSRRFKGVRMRKWGKWVSEVRIPNCKEKIWLGSFDTADQAARAFDAATYCLRGPLAKFNFPNSLPAIPSATPLSPRQIRQAAVNYALGLIPSDESASNLPENATPTPPPPPMPPQASRLSVSSEMGASSEVVEELDSTMWDSLFADSDYNHSFDLKNFPFLQPSTSPREEQGPLLFDDIADLA